MQPNSLEKESEIILDFFAGSGTTAQAVMELNAEDRGNREFILVQLDEEIKESKKAAYDFCKNELKSEKPVIGDITIERVKRAGEKIASANKNLDLGFCVYSLVDKPKIISDEEDSLNLKEQSTLSAFEKARNLALKSTKPLNKELKELVKNKLYQCQKDFYLIESDEKVQEILSKNTQAHIYISAFADIELEDLLNLKSKNKNIKVCY